jgi:hypothetical protein
LDALKTFYASNTDPEVLVLQGACFKTPGTKKETEEEHDFVIVAKNIKSIICIESKKSLSGKRIKAIAKHEDPCGEVFQPATALRGVELCGSHAL